MTKKGHAPAPGVVRHRIGNALKEARLGAGKKQEEAARYLEVSKATIMRIEATGKLKRIELEALLRLYGADESKIKNLIEMHERSNQEAPYAAYQNTEGVDESYLLYLQFELSADLISNFEPILIPGLLQTEDYSRAVLAAVELQSGETIDVLVDLRIERQNLVSGGTHAPERRFIMDESAIRRLVGGPSVMKAQLTQLIELGEDEQVSIQIVPFDRGLYRHSRIPYVLLELPPPDHATEMDAAWENVLYIENPLGQFVIHEEGHGQAGMRPLEQQGFDEYRLVFQKLVNDIALTEKQSANTIREIMKNL